MYWRDKSIFRTVLYSRLPKGNLSLTGFTLLEVLLVVVIISIIVSVATPGFRRSLSTLQLANTTEDIAQFMRLIRERARGEGASYRLKFDIAGGRYFLEKAGQAGETRKIPGGVNLISTVNPIYFYRDGSIDKVNVYLFKGKSEFYKDLEKAIYKEFDIGMIQDVAHTDRIYTITCHPSIGRIEVIPPS